MSLTRGGKPPGWVSRIGPTPAAVSSHFYRGIDMESKLTPEMSQALDRAMTAAASDPLVEALEAIQQLVDAGDKIDEDYYDSIDAAQARARAVLAKFLPVSDSDTLKS